MYNIRAINEVNARMLYSLVKVTPTSERRLAIGKDGEVLLPNSTDLKAFKKFTERIGYCLCGRKTWEDWRKNLKEDDGRKFIVLTHDKESLKDDPLVYAIADNVDEILEYVKENEIDLVVCGGGSIYEQMAEYEDVCISVYVDGDEVQDVEGLVYYEPNPYITDAFIYPYEGLTILIETKEKNTEHKRIYGYDEWERNEELSELE
jgi:dihydrofolate reductase